MSGVSILAAIVSLAVGAIGTYVTFYFRGALARRAEIAKSLADFYSAAATVYYVERDRRKDESRSDGNEMTFYQLYDQRYKEFLGSSTLLASLVPPELREEVLKIEDLWDEINDKGLAVVTGKVWLDALDSIRYKILDSIAYSRLTDPFWRW